MEPEEAIRRSYDRIYEEGDLDRFGHAMGRLEAIAEGLLAAAMGAEALHEKAAPPGEEPKEGEIPARFARMRAPMKKELAGPVWELRSAVEEIRDAHEAERIRLSMSVRDLGSALTGIDSPAPLHDAVLRSEGQEQPTADAETAGVTNSSDVDASINPDNPLLDRGVYRLPFRFPDGSEPYIAVDEDGVMRGMQLVPEHEFARPEPTISDLNCLLDSPGREQEPETEEV